MATGFPIHPDTGLLIDPSTGRMLTRGSLEPCDFIYDFATGQIRLATLDGDGGEAEDEPAAISSSTGGAAGSGPDTGTVTSGHARPAGDGTSATTAPTASIGMSPSAMTVVLGSLLAVGGLWYFFVFVKRPAPKRRHHG